MTEVLRPFDLLCDFLRPIRFDVRQRLGVAVGDERANDRALLVNRFDGL